MADSTIDQVEAAAFESDRESQHKGESGSALIFNPQASFSSVLAAASSRAQTLHCLLDAWQCEEGGINTTAKELAFIAEPIAQEIELILAHLHDLVKREVTHA